jgi:hypothetical protein
VSENSLIRVEIVYPACVWSELVYVFGSGYPHGDIAMDAQRILVLAAAIAAAPALAQPVVITGQTPENPADTVISADLPGGTFVYDDQRAGETVVAPRDATVQTIRFWGGSETSFGNDSNTLGFRLSVFDLDESTGALSLVDKRRVARGFATPIQTANQMGDFGAQIFEYEIDLDDSPIQLDGGHPYVVSIAAITFVPPREARESWAWATATGDDEILLDLFDGAGLLPTQNVASGLALELVGEMQAPECVADVNQDGALTPTDFSAWISAYNTGDMRADQNLDGDITPTDFSAWIANYNAGC